MVDINKIVDEQLKPVIDAKNNNLKQLSDNAAEFRNKKGRFAGMSCQLAILVFIFGCFQGGGMYNASGYFSSGKTDGTIMSCNEDKLRLVGVQKSVTNAFTTKLTELQSMFNRAKTDPSISTNDLRSKVAEVQAGLAHLREVAGKDNPFDDASAQSITDACNKLAGQNGLLDTVDKNYRGLSDLYAKAATPGDVGASSIIKEFNDQYSAVGTTTQTVSNTTSTRMTMYQSMGQQFLGILNGMLHSISTLLSAAVKGQNS